jgi:hypothetical protein
VERLLGKVDRLAAKESERMTATKSFVSTLKTSSSDLCLCLPSRARTHPLC